VATSYQQKSAAARSAGNVFFGCSKTEFAAERSLQFPSYWKRPKNGEREKFCHFFLKNVWVAFEQVAGGGQTSAVIGGLLLYREGGTCRHAETGTN